MRVTFFSLLLFLSFNSYSLNLKATKGLQWEELAINSQGLFLSGHNLDLSVKERNCTSELIKRFKNSLEVMLERTTKSINDKNAQVKFTYNSKEYSVSRRSRLGQYLKNIPNEVQKLKLKESYRKCN